MDIQTEKKMRKIKSILGTLLAIFAFASCEVPGGAQKNDGNDVDLYGMPIDFSNVGYHQGESKIPSYPVSVTLTAPADGADATELIQNALNQVPSPGAVLLKEGQYYVGGSIKIERDGVVLRGEGQGTIIRATGTSTRSLIVLGKSTSRQMSGEEMVQGEFVAAGQKWVAVTNPSSFKHGDRVGLCFRPNSKWVSDLKMDQIAQNADNSVKQWTPGDYVMVWERTVDHVDGAKVWFDAPVVMELHSKYATKISLSHVQWDRIEESGIEDLMLVSDYDPAVLDSDGNLADEKHSWNAIDVKCAENCWVSGVKSAHFAGSLVDMKTGSRQITVKDCVSTEPVSLITGSRRYAFHISGGQMCLVENCRAEHDRHGFVTGARVPGPNVFLDCEMVNAYSDIGPHHRWASGVLYDNCTTDRRIEVQDRAGYGTGHGWAGVSIVYWNCKGSSIVCQSPWVNGKNWCIGCIGTRWEGRKYSDGLKRPVGEWHSYGVPVEPQSLYRYQFDLRCGK